MHIQQPSVLKPVLIFTCIAVLLVITRMAASFLIPILLSAFFAVLLTPTFRWLKKRMAKGLALFLSIGVLIACAIFIILLVGNSMDTLQTSLESYRNEFTQREVEIDAQVESFSQAVGFSPPSFTVDPAAMVDTLTYVITNVAEIAKDSFIILMLTAFLLAEGPQFIQRMRVAFGPDHYLPPTVIAQAQMVITYFGLRIFVNLLVATATGVMLWLLGIDYAGLWAVLLFFMSFVPYIGAIIAMIPPVLLAFAEGGLGLAILVGVLALVINGLAENILQPMIMSKGLSISPTVAFLSCMFWMFILNGTGAILAMPMTMALVMLMSDFEETRGIAAIMITKLDTPEPNPSPEVTPTT